MEGKKAKEQGHKSERGMNLLITYLESVLVTRSSLVKVTMVKQMRGSRRREEGGKRNELRKRRANFCSFSFSLFLLTLFSRIRYFEERRTPYDQR